MHTPDPEASSQPYVASETALRRGPGPRITVVFAPRTQPESLRRAVFDMHSACAASGADLVVVHSWQQSALGTLPRVRVVGAPADADVCMRREIGARHASGDVVLFAEVADSASLLLRLAHLRAAVTNSSPRTGTTIEPAPRYGISVIVPVHEGAPLLRQTLAGLVANGLPRQDWELIVVCDACTDESAAIASRHADVVVRLPGPRMYGPAYARNRGAEIATSECLAFVASDVRVHAGVLASFEKALGQDPGLAAIVGTYDAQPMARGFVSQYRGLVTHWVQRNQHSSAAGFWSGCGAVRRASFQLAGGYDEWRFRRPEVEDAEFGQRLRALGHRVELRTGILATYLKKWTFWGSMGADMYQIGGPWARLENGRATALRMGVPTRRWTERANTLFSAGAVAALIGGVVYNPALMALLAILCLAGLVWLNRDQFHFLRQSRGWWFAAAAVPMEILHYLLNAMARMAGQLTLLVLGEPRPSPAVEAFAEMGVRTWPPVPRRRL